MDTNDIATFMILHDFQQMQHSELHNLTSQTKVKKSVCRNIEPRKSHYSPKTIINPSIPAHRSFVNNNPNKESPFTDWSIQQFGEHNDYCCYVRVKIIDVNSIIIEAKYDNNLISKKEFSEKIQAQILKAFETRRFKIKAKPADKETELIFAELGFI